jgi:hypothetical protein
LNFDHKPQKPQINRKSADGKMVATGGLLLSCLAASRYDCHHHHGNIGFTNQYQTALFGVEPSRSSSSSEPRQGRNETIPLSSPPQAEIGVVNEDSLQKILDEHSPKQPQKWEARFSLLVQYKNREGNCIVPLPHIEGGEKLGIWVANTRHFKKTGKLIQERIDRLDDIAFEWSVSEAYREKMFTLLKQYKTRTGDCNVPQRHVEDGENLGTWVLTKRQFHKKGTLTQDYVKSLEAIGFIWDTPVSLEWNNMFSLLEQYNTREGDCNVPANHTEGGNKLGTWVARTRQLKKKGKLRQGKIDRLDEMAFAWSVSEAHWETMSTLLKQYKARTGDYNVPQHHVEDGENLGIWVLTKRNSHRKGTLAQDYVKRLEVIGFIWDTPVSLEWNNMFSLLEQYNMREGDCNVPTTHTEGEAKLGSWAARTRHFKKKGRLSQDKIDRLGEIGFVWNVSEEYWKKMFSLLKQYKAREGDCSVLQRHIEDGETLGSWVNNARQLVRKGNLDPEKQKLLEGIGFSGKRPVECHDDSVDPHLTITRREEDLPRLDGKYRIRF